MTELTADEKQAVLRDFEQWSGGFRPHECEDREIESYIEHAADPKLNDAAIRHFFAEECKA